MNRLATLVMLFPLLLPLAVSGVDAVDVNVCESNAQRMQSQNLLQRHDVAKHTTDDDESAREFPGSWLNYSLTTFGGKMLATKPPLLRCSETRYRPSQLERRFKEQVLELTDDSDILCDALRGATAQWINMNLEETEASPSSDIFSQICPEMAKEQIIEPLAGVLRDPRMFCLDDSRQTLMSVDWLVLADNQSFPTSPNTRRMFFDAGGSNFGDATQFFATKYAERGLDFDQIFVWEAAERNASTYWDGVAADVRAKWEPRLTWFNGIPVTAEKGAEHNPVHRIHQLCKAQDFCAFKLDVDTPSVEYPLVLQLIDDPGHLKEFFFEHHVENKLMHRFWKHDVNGSFQDSYNLFTALREKGVRAHSWI